MASDSPERSGSAKKAGIILLLCLLALIVWFLGQSGKRTPKGDADGVVVSPSDGTPAEAATLVPPTTILLEIQVTATDELPVEGHNEDLQPAPQAIRIVPGEERPRVLATSLPELIRLATQDARIEVSDSITSPGDIRAVIALSVVYEGKGRNGERETMRLLGTPKGSMGAEMPKKLSIGPLARPEELLGFFPWPASLTWNALDDGKLELVCGEKKQTLSPGETAGPFEAQASVPCRLGGIKPAAMGDMDLDPLPEVDWEELGPIVFRSTLQVTYHGTITWEVAE